MHQTNGKIPSMSPEAKPSIYDRIGTKGLLKIVFKATPFPFRFITWPYGLAVYRELTQQNYTLTDLQVAHETKCNESPLFRVKFIRPGYRCVKDTLKAEYGID